MNGQKSKTLRIADRVDKFGFGECAEAAAELRRLHEVNAELVEALKFMNEMVDEPPEANCSCHLLAPCSDCVDYSVLREAFSRSRAAIAKATGEEQ